jgi:putative N6-adenine-specific DNA methylase
VCNPPYGLRLGDDAGAGALVKEFGDFLKKRCTGSVAYIYFGRRNLLKHIGLHPSAKWPLKSGGLDGRLARFELY